MFAEFTAHMLWAVKQIIVAIGLSINYMYTVCHSLIIIHLHLV